MTELTKETIEALSKPFDPGKVNLKVQTKPNDNGNALIVSYMDARDVIERLNSVVAGEWSDTYTTVNGGLECALTICGVTRRDVGSNDNDNEPVKSAYSDALKRAAVKFGVGLYLYGLPKVWGKVKTIGKNFYIFDQAEESNIRARLFGKVPNTEPEGHAERTVDHATGEITSKSIPSKQEIKHITDSQKQMLFKLWKEVNGGTEAETDIALKALLVSKFKHPAEQTTTAEASDVINELLAKKKEKKQ